MDWLDRILIAIVLICSSFIAQGLDVESSQAWIVDFEAGEGGYPAGPRMTLRSNGVYSISNQFPSKELSCQNVLEGGDLSDIDGRVNAILAMAPEEWDWTWEPDPNCPADTVRYRIALWPDPPDERQPKMFWKEFDACKTRLVEDEWIEFAREMRKVARNANAQCQVKEYRNDA